jgi:hypothetical protein
VKTAYKARAALAAALITFGGLPASALTIGFAAPGASGNFEQRLQDASLVISTAREGEGTAQDLLAAAQADYARMVGVLYAQGYYGGEVRIRVNGQEAAEIPVLDLEANADAALTRIIDEGRRARDEDGIGAIVLGCGGMADLREEIGDEVGLPVIEGVTAAVKLAEALVGLGLGTSKVGDLAFPRPKAFTGRFAHFADLTPGR